MDQETFEQVVPQAYRYWLGNYERDLRRADEMVRELIGFQPAKRAWLRFARDASWISARAAGERIGVSHAAWMKLEQGEESGTISLANLRRAAEALDCELLYIVRPKEGQLFSERIWQRLEPKVRDVFQKRFSSPAYAARSTTTWAILALSSIAMELGSSTKFLRSMNWSRRTH